MKKNIVLFSGRDAYGIEKEYKKWIQTFREKYSEMNIEYISLDTIREWGNMIRQNILSGGIFAEKRLFVISGGNEKRDKTTNFVDFFEKIFDILPDDHFLLFHWLKERAWDLIPLIQKIWETRTFDSLFSIETWQNRFPSLDEYIIKTVITSYSEQDKLLEEWEKNSSLSYDIASTLNSLELLAISKKIEKEDIEYVLGMHGGWKVFDLIDAISAKNIQKSLEIFQKLIQTKDIFEVTATLITLLRNVLYIKYAIANNVDPTKLKIHPYVLKKTINSPISLQEIQKIHSEMVRINIAYKSGNWMKDIELWRILEIELGILWLKK